MSYSELLDHFKALTAEEREDFKVFLQERLTETVETSTKRERLLAFLRGHQGLVLDLLPVRIDLVVPDALRLSWGYKKVGGRWTFPVSRSVDRVSVEGAILDEEIRYRGQVEEAMRRILQEAEAIDMEPEGAFSVVGEAILREKGSKSP